MQRHHKLSLVSGLLALSLLTGCANQPLAPGVIASVNGTSITKQQFDEMFGHMSNTIKIPGTAADDPKLKPIFDMVKKMALQNLIFDTFIKQEAAKRHLDVSSTEVQALFNQQTMQLGGQKNLDEALKKYGISENDLKDHIKDQLLKDKVITAIAGDQLKVTDADAKAYYDAHQKEFDLPEQVRARHILISADEAKIKADISAKDKGASPEAIQKQVATMMAEKRQKAQTLLQKIKADPNAFAILAAADSDDSVSAKNGGDLGYFSKDMMVPPFADAAFSTKPGQITDHLVQSNYGYHIIQVLDRKAPENKTYDEVKPEIVKTLENQKREEIMQTWLQDQKKHAHIQIADGYNFLKEDNADNGPASVAQPPSGKSSAPTTRQGK